MGTNMRNAKRVQVVLTRAGCVVALFAIVLLTTRTASPVSTTATTAITPLTTAAMSAAFEGGGEAGGGVLFVDDDAPANGDGLSWDTAYRFLQDALVFTSDPANGVAEIRVAQGTYEPDRDEANPDGTGDREATINLVNNLTLAGGYAGLGAEDPDVRDVELYETILSGEIGDEGDLEDNSWHVATAEETNSSAVLSGFTVTAGYAAGNDLDLAESNGGGLYVVDASPIIVATTFLQNSAPSTASSHGGRGGGAYVASGAPVFDNCTFDDNFAHEGGGGAGSVGAPMFRDCVFIANGASASRFGIGGGLLSEGGTAHLLSCHFEDNFAGGAGGAINARDTDLVMESSSFIANEASDGGALDVEGGSARIVQCTFEANETDNSGTGGAVYVDNVQSLVLDCLFTNNSAVRGGGMFFTGEIQIVNCWFEGNVATDEGGALAAYGSMTLYGCVFLHNVSENEAAAIHCMDGDVAIANCTLTENTSNGDGDGDGLFLALSAATVTNTILWFNGGADFASQVHVGAESTLDLNYSVIQTTGGPPDGVGNIGLDPKFVDVRAGDLRLSPGSRAIDAGNNGAVLPCALDLDGNLRFVDDPRTTDIGVGRGPIVDIGAYEFLSFPSDEDCNANTLVDSCEIEEGISFDCNDNGVPDDCDIDQGFSLDCDFNGIPDECDLDCNGNGFPDECDFADGFSFDCNLNGFPDECDIADGASLDCNGNGIPDECEHDCNGNGVPDDCDIANGDSVDRNGDGVPDECEVIQNVTQGTYFATLQLAIDGAEDGDVVVVQPGTYNELITFNEQGITLLSVAGPEATIIDGGRAGSVVTFTGEQDVETVIDGFTITGGFAIWGGGIVNLGANPTIRNCVFTDNEADFLNGGKGGAIFNGEDTIPLIESCVFESNVAVSGGAIYNDEDAQPTIVDCLFHANEAKDDGGCPGGGAGGAIYNSQSAGFIERCTFEANISLGCTSNEEIGGGAIYSVSFKGTVSDCVFLGNMTDRSGGAVGSNNGGETYVNCIFQDNVADFWGGALLFNDSSSDAFIVNCLIIDNIALEAGGGVYGFRENEYRVVNSTVTGNKAGAGPGVFHEEGIGEFHSCIIWGNIGGAGSDFEFDGQSPTVRYCNVKGGFFGISNIDQDPLFTDPARGDYRLAAGSPSIDSGHPYLNVEIFGLDLGGEDRVTGCRVDMGAFESLLPGQDCDGNGVSDGCDILSGTLADCDRNGIPDECDIASGAVADCNENGIPDGCEVAPVFAVDSGPLSPFGENSPQSFTIVDPPQARGDVTLYMRVHADLVGEDVEVRVNGWWIGRVFDNEFTNCRLICEEAQLVISQADFNHLVANGALEFLFEPDDGMDALACEGNSYISARLEYIAVPTASDCDGNDVPDDCDLPSADCNDNGVPDACDLNDVAPFFAQSEELSPIGADFPQSFVIADPPKAQGEVTVTIWARADLDLINQHLELDLNGEFLTVLFAAGANHCPENPDMRVTTIPAQVFNSRIGDEAEFTITTSHNVHPEQCEPLLTFVQITVEYDGVGGDNDCNSNWVPDECDIAGGDSEDQNQNGVPDECETPGDLDGDGVVDANDLITLLGAWGPCADCGNCAADLDGDCTVGPSDLIILLGNWG